MSTCRLCLASRLGFLTDFGQLAITNQYLRSADEPARRWPLSWVECESCGVVQLADVPPVELLRPRFDWISYLEPERHLDHIAAVIGRLSGRQPCQRIMGLTYKDDSLLKRLDWGTTRRLDPVTDLGVVDTPHGLESLQARWTVERAREVVSRCGRVDVLIVRHVLEHAQDAAGFLAACRELLAPDGILVLEVPDCERAFVEVDVTVLWEEHVLYFTEQSLSRGLRQVGFQPIEFHRAQYTLEDCLLWIGRAAPKSSLPEGGSQQPVTDPQVRQFAHLWPTRRDAIRDWAVQNQRDGGRLAVYGAGHRACTFIDVMGLSDCLACVIDDAPQKQSLRLPVGTVPIKGSRSLLEDRITCCLLAVNPEMEERIVQQNAEFTARGGQFVSCFPCSPRAWRP